MTDAELETWWPAFATVVTELRRADRPAVAGLLLDAVRAGSTSGEILGGIGAVLRDHRALRFKLSDAGAKAWDAVIAAVYRAYPMARLALWFARLIRR